MKNGETAVGVPAIGVSQQGLSEDDRLRMPPCRATFLLPHDYRVTLVIYYGQARGRGLQTSPATLGFPMSLLEIVLRILTVVAVEFAGCCSRSSRRSLHVSVLRPAFSVRWM